jgi:hypothetical protein
VLRKSFTIAVALLGLWASTAAAQTAGPSSPEERFLAGLRERQLFRLAEAYCRERLADTYLVDRRRAELAVELSRTVLEAALYARSPEREALFERAATTLDDPQLRPRDPVWRAPLDVQRGVVELVRGERLREEAQLLAAAAAPLDQARDYLRSAAARLTKVRETVAELLRDANRRRDAKPELPTAAELAALQRNVEYQLARALWNQGRSYPYGSPDRMSSVERAIETLENLSRAEMNDSVAWEARLDEVECRRMLGDLTAAERMLDLIDGQSPPADVADRARAQRIRVRLQADELEEARKFVRESDADESSDVGGDVRLAVLQWLLATAAKADKAGAKTTAETERAKAVALGAMIARRNGPYWGRRAETELAAAVVASPAAGDVALLVKAAESFYQQGSPDRALEVYDQAAEKARAAGQLDAAFAAGLSAAAIEQARARHAEAARRFAALAASAPMHPQAAEAQLSAAFHTAQLLAAAKTPAESAAVVDAYGKLLDDHLAHWPKHRTSAQARIWLARLRRQQGNSAAAVAALSGVAPSDPAAAEAVAILVDALDSQLAAGATTIPDAERILKPLVESQAVGQGTAIARQAATIGLARLETAFAWDRFAAAADALENELKSNELPAALRDQARAWLVVAQVGAGRLAAAGTAAEQLSGIDPPAAVAAVGRLHAVAQRVAPPDRKLTAGIVLRFAEAMRAAAAKLPPDDRRRLAAAEADALATLGRTAEARRLFEATAAEFPADGALQQSYAEFLAAQPDAAAHTAAAAKWREIERGAGENSPLWYRARLGTAEAHARLGDKARALQLIDIAAALHPDLGGPEMKARFDALRKSLAAMP